MAAILALGKRKNNQEWKHIPPQLSFISFSCSKVHYSICSQREPAPCCVYCVTLQTVASILQTQNPLAVHVFKVHKSKKIKNDFGTDPRTPLAYAGCFPAQLPRIAQQVAVAMNHRSSATVPTAQGLCQTLSVSLPVWRLLYFLYCHAPKGETQSFCCPR